jgi:hypothetical protein
MFSMLFADHFTEDNSLTGIDLTGLEVCAG